MSCFVFCDGKSGNTSGRSLRHSVVLLVQRRVNLNENIGHVLNDWGIFRCLSTILLKSE